MRTFQSTHPQRVRHIHQAQVYTGKGFNPRTRKGCDLPTFTQLYFVNMFQSTHPQRVRLKLVMFQPAKTCFNPRTRKGCDNNGSTLSGIKRSFNPRTRKGCDSVHTQPLILVSVSIHAPAKGATRCFDCRRCQTQCFNPRTRKGCDQTALPVL